MTRLRIAVLLGLCLAVSGCAAGPTGPVVTDHPVSSQRKNEQPKLLSCMVGDLLCTSQS